MKRRGIALCALMLAGGLAWGQLDAANTFTLISGGSGYFGAFPQGLSADGSRIYFFTNEDLLAGDNDGGRSDVYLRANGTLSLLSPGSAAADANFAGELPDGSALIVTADPLLPAEDGDTENDIYRNTNGTLSLVTAGTTKPVEFKRVYGSRVFFETTEQLSTDDTDLLLDVYAWSGLGDSIVLVTPGTPNWDARVPDGLPSTRSNIVATADGSAIIISTSEPISPDDDDTQQDLYRFEDGSATLLTGGSQDLYAAFEGASAGLTRVFFRTSESLSADDGDSVEDVYEAMNSVITLLSGSTNDSSVGFLDASADGTKVFIRAASIPLAAGGSTSGNDIYQSSAGALTLVSGTGSAGVLFGGIADDGSRVFFMTPDPLTASDPDTFNDVYEWMNGSLTLVSTGGSATCPVSGMCGAFYAGASSDGTSVLFLTSESLLAEDTDGGQRDAYVASGGVLSLRGAADGGAIGTPDMSVVLLVTSEQLDPADGDFGAFDIYTSVISGPPPEDELAPTIICAAADGSWHANNVTLACTASDAGSGLADPDDASFDLTTNVADGDEESNAFTGSRQVCDMADNCATAQVGGNKIDRRGPTVLVTSPAAAAEFTVGQVVLASYSCNDTGSGMQSCVGSVASGSAIDTASAGNKSFGVIGTDAVGNVGTANVSYSVVPAGGGGGTFTFGGFQQPVDPLPALNSMKAGGAVPVKFSLGGPQGLSIFAAGYPRSEPIACTAGASEVGIEQVTTAGNSSLSYDAATDLYSFIWKTNKAWSGTCRQLVMQFSDGSIQRADFKFR